uniref:CDC45 domain-containing protein n=1 Tax=Meloidogyne hapla TaxID=6305 RepID=A0A1I8AZL5_MELHA
MIISNDFRLQFYEELRKDHILIIVNADVDALCATAILTHLFSCDEVTYTLIPVNSIEGLKSSIKIHGKQTKNIILMNCVGSNSLLDFELPSNVNFWIIESRRPIHLDNIYNVDSIKVLTESSELPDWNVPDANSIYEHEEQSGSESEEEEGEDVEGEYIDREEEEEDGEVDELVENDQQSQEGRNSIIKRRGKRKHLADIIASRTLKRQRRTHWKRARGTILWEYYLKISVFMLELAHELGKSSAEIMWCSAVGISSQFIDQIISVEKYTDICADRMKPFILKFGPRSAALNDQNRNHLTVSFKEDLILPLYSRWTLYESMLNESHFICESKLWSQRGEDKFKEILSKIGLTLAECRQNFEVIKKDRRLEIFKIIKEYLNKTFASFNTNFGFNSTYNAVDFARILTIRLEWNQADKPDLELSRRFESTNEILREFFKTGGRELPPLKHSVELYKMALRSLNELVKRSIAQKHVVLMSRFFLLSLSDQCSMLGFLSSRHFLFLFFHSVLRAYVSTNPSSRGTKPFILIFPLLGEQSGWYLISGLMPLVEIMADTSGKSVIGSAFKHVAREANIEIRHTFDSNGLIFIFKANKPLFIFSCDDTGIGSISFS